MRVAFITFEYPPSVAIGGIGTYAWHATRMLADAGHDVLVFAAGLVAGLERPHPRIEVRRVPVTQRAEFPAAVVAPLLEAHRHSAIELIEAPEIGPEGGPAFAALPAAARVLKLHTPTFLVVRNGYDSPRAAQRLRFGIGALRRGRWAVLRAPVYEREQDPEYRTAILADEFAAPSRAIGDVLRAEWSLPAERIGFYPVPCYPDPALLALEPPVAARTFGFIGRLEARKGVTELVAAIPTILAQAPDLRFRFIGPSWQHDGTDMKSWILSRYPRCQHALEFVGPVTPGQVPAELARCDALVLPSRWESFGYTCVESMMSGRAVIGSASGGMAELIEDGTSGLLVPPRDPAAIAAAVLRLALEPGLATVLGAAARRHITALLSPARILPLQLASYERALEHAQLRQP